MQFLMCDSRTCGKRKKFVTRSNRKFQLFHFLALMVLECPHRVVQFEC